jgi:carboxymethylenebutenolidase
MAIKQSMIDFPINAHAAPGYLAQPADEAPHPGVVVIQEWWGLVPHIQDVAERLAREGFIALAPDLYHGQTAGEPDEARKLAMALDTQRAVQEIAAAARYLKKMQHVIPKKVGVVGWCMGGGLSLSTAAHQADLIGAAVVFYGRPLTASDTAKLQVPVLGLYAEHDHGIPVEAVRAFEAEMQKQNVPHEVHVYTGASHAFFNDTRLQVYQAAAAQDAWQRTLAWFKRYLVNG